MGSTSAVEQLCLSGMQEPGQYRRYYERVTDAEVGHTYGWERTFTERDVRLMGEASGDYNPIHFDPKYAAGSRFGHPIMHALSGIAEISRVLGNEFPGIGTIWRKLECTFLNAIYPGDTVQYVATVKVVVPEKKRIFIAFEGKVGQMRVLESCSWVWLPDPEPMST